MASMSQTNSPEQLHDMADAAEAGDPQQQQQDNHHEQHLQVQETGAAADDDAEMAIDGDAAEHEVDGDKDGTAQPADDDASSAAQHLAQDDFDDEATDDDDDDELQLREEEAADSAHDAPVDDGDDTPVNADAADGVSASAAAGDDTEAGTPHDAESATTNGADDAEAATSADGDQVAETAADAEADDAASPAGADTEEAEISECATTGGADASVEVETPAVESGGDSDSAAAEETVGDVNAGDVNMEPDAEANAEDAAMQEDAEASAEDEHAQEDRASDETAADDDAQGQFQEAAQGEDAGADEHSASEHPQDQHHGASNETERQQDEHDPADPNFDQNAYDPKSPVHAHDEYDPADTVSASSYERHGSDEYDPANPGGLDEYDESARGHHDREEYDPENPAYDQDVYDPSNPSYDHSNGDEKAAGDNANPTAKRKAAGSELATPEHSQSGERDVKRPRGDSHDSTKSLDATRRDEDKKGLTDAAWDRLKDFQTLGEFRMNQVSRAAFASVGALPEFAQVSVIARFTRVPMRGVRDKNGQLMRIHHEYLKENPHVASLQPVSAFVADPAADPGLFAFGYAPPLPVHGMSSVPVPYQKEDPVDQRRASSSSSMTSSRHLQTAPVTTPAPTATAAVPPAESMSKTQATTDEFGRVVNKPATASSPSVSSETSDRPPAAAAVSAAAVRPLDPRRTAHEKMDESQAQQQSSARSEAGGLLSAGKPIDPRRRHAGESEFVPRSLNAGGDGFTGARSPREGGFSPRGQPGDPRRRNLPTASASAAASHPLHAGKNELFERLPLSVRTVLDNMVSEGRLSEAINDNVLSRLNHLPEHIALHAVENFSNVDLSHIDNLQGFLVGIINRVNEKANSAERSAPGRPGALMATPAPAPSAAPASGYGRHEGGAASAYSTGAAVHHGSQQVPYSSREQPTAYREPPAAQTSPVAVAGGGYDPRQYGVAPPAHAMDSMQRGTYPVPAIPGALGAPPAAFVPPPQQQHAITTLPLSVQQRLQSMVATGVISSIDEFGDKCYDVLGELSEGLANEVLTRFMNANLTTVRNRNGFLIGVIKRCRQEYGFNN